MKIAKNTRGETVYRCVFSHEHGSATTAVLCEQAPRLDVRAEHRLEGHDMREGYLCKRCGARALSAYRLLVTLEHRECPGSPFEAQAGTQVARTCTDDEDASVVLGWRAEAKAFHEKHTGCNAEGNA